LVRFQYAFWRALNFGNKTIPVSGQCFDKARVCRGVGKRYSQFVYGAVEALFEIAGLGIGP